MSTIAVLGTGLLGAGFAYKAMDNGHSVRVWNRTAAKAAPIAEAGAHHAQSPAEAAQGADRVHLVLSSDDAVESVISQLREGLGQGVWIIDHSTNLPARVAERCERLSAEGVNYLHCPVFMGPSNSRNATGSMLISGGEDLIAQHRAALEEMTGELIVVGPRPQDAAVRKIIGNGLIIGLAGLGGDLLQLGKEAGWSVEQTLDAIGAFSPMGKGMAKRAAAYGTRPASFELSMARKDIGLMIETAGADKCCILPGLAQSMDALIQDGQGQEDFTAVAALK
ncbi:MAG: NAD(P)-binding domain-containing protein [Myxococcota bacterium]|nr:NAD(P)-binding domain-containing protein [Myxococcota bacterium]